MKRKKMNRLLVLGCFFTTLVLNAQEQILDCKYNIQEALFYLKGSSTIEKDINGFLTTKDHQPIEMVFFKLT